ncbi:MAG TPA: hypothetical protein VGB19_09050 [Actinomycetota bacterium]
MWVRTQEDELVNMEHIEYVLVELEEDEGTYELRAYAIGWEPEGEGEFYTLAATPTDGEAASAMDRLASSLQRGDSMVDFRDVAGRSWSGASE